MKRTHKLTFSYRHSCNVNNRRVWYVDPLPGRGLVAHDGLAHMFAERCAQAIEAKGCSTRVRPFFDGFILISEGKR